MHCNYNRVKPVKQGKHHPNLEFILFDKITLVFLFLLPSKCKICVILRKLPHLWTAGCRLYSILRFFKIFSNYVYHFSEMYDILLYQKNPAH